MSILVIFGVHMLLSYFRLHDKPVKSPSPQTILKRQPASHRPEVSDNLSRELEKKHTTNPELERSLQNDRTSEIPNAQELLDDHLQSEMKNSLESFTIRQPSHLGHPQGPPVGEVEESPMRLPITKGELTRQPPKNMSSGVHHIGDDGEIHASNEFAQETSAEFTSQFTDVASYFKSNPKSILRDIDPPSYPSLQHNLRSP